VAAFGDLHTSSGTHAFPSLADRRPPLGRRVRSRLKRHRHPGRTGYVDATTYREKGGESNEVGEGESGVSGGSTRHMSVERGCSGWAYHLGVCLG
jgi:hypothetical protein